MADLQTHAAISEKYVLQIAGVFKGFLKGFRKLILIRNIPAGFCICFYVCLGRRVIYTILNLLFMY